MQNQVHVDLYLRRFGLTTEKNVIFQKLLTNCKKWAAVTRCQCILKKIWNFMKNKIFNINKNVWFVMCMDPTYNRDSITQSQS